MKQLLLACLLFAATPAFADEWQCSRDGVMYQSSRVIDLPQDQGKLFTTVIGQANDPQVQQMLRWFDQNPELNRIKQTSHFHFLSSESVMFKSRYDATTGDVPCLRIQQPDGTVIYQCSRRNLPLSPEALANSISTTCLRRNVQPEPQPNLHFHYTVAPAPDLEPEPTPDIQPDVFTNSNAMQGKWWMLAIAGVASTFAGVAWQWKKSYEE
jgi:hypothetical protein